MKCSAWIEFIAEDGDFKYKCELQKGHQSKHLAFFEHAEAEGSPHAFSWCDSNEPVMVHYSKLAEIEGEEFVGVPSFMVTCKLIRKFKIPEEGIEFDPMNLGKTK